MPCASTSTCIFVSSPFYQAQRLPDSATCVDFVDIYTNLTDNERPVSKGVWLLQRKHPKARDDQFGAIGQAVSQTGQAVLIRPAR